MDYSLNNMDEPPDMPISTLTAMPNAMDEEPPDLTEEQLAKLKAGVSSTAEPTPEAEPTVGGVENLYLNMAGEMASDAYGATKKLGSEALDYYKQTGKTLLTLGGPAKVAAGLAESGVQFTAGALSWMPAALTMVGTTALGKMFQGAQKIENAINTKQQPVIDDYGIAKRAEETSNTVGQILPNLVGQPRTELGKKAYHLVGNAFETMVAPIHEAGEYYKELGYPNFGNTLVVVAEALMFERMHKYGTRGKEFARRTIERMRKKVSKAKSPSELLNAIDNVAKKADVVVPEATKSELSQKSKGFDNVPPRPPEIKPEVTLPLVTPEPKVMQKARLVEEIPGEKQTWQIGAPEEVAPKVGSTVKLVEEIPGKKKVYQIFNNETGAVNLDELKKWGNKFGEIKGDVLLSKLKKNGVNESDMQFTGLPVFLNKTGRNNVDWKELEEIVKEGGFGIEKEVKSEQGGLSDVERLELDALKMHDETGYELTPKDMERIKELEGQLTEGKTLYGPEKNPEYNLENYEPGTYREVIYKFDPADGSVYKEPHYGPHAMAHGRIHDRIVARDKKATYLEEAQSNWHKEGRTNGYLGEDRTGWKAEIVGEFIENGKRWFEVRDAKGNWMANLYADSPEQAIKLASPKETLLVPDAPLKKTWPHMIMRDVIRDAVNGDKDGVAWSTGKIQAERWGDKKMPTRDAVYDKTLKKFMERESGVKPELVDTVVEPVSGLEVYPGRDIKGNPIWEVIDLNGITHGSYTTPLEAIKAKLKLFRERGAIEGKEKVWYVPLTDKLRKSVLGSKASEAFELLLAPIMNNRGSVRIPRKVSKLMKELGKERIEKVKEFGKKAEASKLRLTDYLIKKGMNEKQAKEVTRIHDLLKQDAPFEFAQAVPPPIEGKNPIGFESGDVNVNISKSKKVNPSQKIPKRVLDALQAIPRIRQSKLSKAISTTWASIERTGSAYLKDLWHEVNAIEAARLEDMQGVKGKVKDLRERYSDKKLRQEAFVKIMSQDKLGRDALEKSGIKPIEADTPIEYDLLVKELEPLFESLLNRVNETRVKIGKKPINRIKNYLPMIAQEHIYDKLRILFKEDKEINGRPNLVFDDINAIDYRHSYNTAEATNFNHIKRGPLRSGVKLEIDPLKLYAQYANTATRHIHYSPFNAFIEQLVNVPLKDPATGQSWKMIQRNKPLADFLNRWSNKLAGRPNVMLPDTLRFIETGAQKLSNNLTVATLGWSARTVLVQPTAMLPVAVEFGFGNALKGLIDTIGRKGDVPVELSDALKIRTADAFVGDTVNISLEGKVKQTVMLPQTKALSAMKMVDAVVAEAAWRTAYKAAKPNMSERQAIRFADEAVIRTQASGFAGDLSPIQMNAIGKAITLWQTYTINHLNWIAKELTDVKRPERNVTESTRRALTYLIGSALISTLFEDVMGIQSPQPAPIKAIIKGLEEGDPAAVAAFKGLMELTELFPVGSSVKFGSDPAGAVAQFLGDASEAIGDLLPKAMNGDKKAAKELAFILAKGLGVPGAQQAKRISTGLSRGETPFGSVVGRYTPKKAKKKSALAPPTQKKSALRRPSRAKSKSGFNAKW